MCLDSKRRKMTDETNNKSDSDFIKEENSRSEQEEVPKPKIKPAYQTRINSPKGLPNLGNTCFFNSAAQCLLATHQLGFYLNEVKKEFNIEVPECDIEVYDKKVHLDAAEIPVSFTKTTFFIDAFKRFITESYSDRSPNPRPVFDQVAQRAPRFRGWHQQDSHELLRYLIDGLRQEEINAINESVRRYFKGKDIEDLDQVRRACMNFAKPVLDQIFSGSLVQIVCCSECKHESVCFEPFLDLSLPIPRCTHSFKPNKFLSKHKQKKAAKKNKKNKKNKRQQKDKAAVKEEIVENGDAVQLECNGVEEVEKTNDENAQKSEILEDDAENVEEEQGNASDESIDDQRPADGNLKVKMDCANPLVFSDIPEGTSIEYALSRFTELEQLQGSNSYECENCCAHVNKEKGQRHKTVIAQKKYLIYSLPPVLTIHLKRFEKTHRFNKIHTTKLSDHVAFPFVLDLAPFCSKSTMQVAKGQTSVLYSLYGIVSHSGSLSGGHYVAYVKSRKPIEHVEKFFKEASNFDASAIGDFDEYKRVVGRFGKMESKDDNLNADLANEGNWYYCSDSHVTRVNKDQVSNTEAFLLFYERIY